MIRRACANIQSLQSFCCLQTQVRRSLRSVAHLIVVQAGLTLSLLEGTNRAIVGLNFLYALDASRGDLVCLINNVKHINDLL